MGGQVTNVLIVGVGGQGTLLASKVLGTAAMAEGHDVKQSEVHGMAQRGGSVVTYVRFGRKVYSPLIEKGEADYILAFERLEALRWVDYLKNEGSIIINDQAILPLPVIIGAQSYPADICDKIRQSGRKMAVVDAATIAREVGEPRTANVVLLGVLARQLPLAVNTWEQAIREVVAPKTLAINVQAFYRGYNL